MKEVQTNNFQRLFVIKALFFIPHHGLLHVAIRCNLKRTVDFLDRVAKKCFIRDKTSRIFDENLVRLYREQTAYTTLWHGSGRFRYDDQGKLDVLNQVIVQEGLCPGYDVYGIFSGGEVMNSLSLTNSRMIGRSYADTFGKGYKETSRYGDALMWVSYYYGLFYARMYTAGLVLVRKYYASWHRLAHNKDGHVVWGKRSHPLARSVWDVFCLGSDIQDNYPILYGVRTVRSRQKLAKIFQEYEVRSADIVTFEDITHIEVPEERIEATRKILAKHKINIPVFSIELGEYFSSRRPFHTLLGWKLGKK